MEEITIEQLIADWKQSTGRDFSRIYQEIKNRNDKRAVGPLIDMLAEETPEDIDDIADYVIDLLCGLRDPRAILPIMNTLHRIDFKSSVGIMAFGKQALPALVDALRSEHWLTRHNAAYLLGYKNVFGEEPIEPLIQVALDESEHFGIRSMAVWSLGRIGDKRALEPLMSLLSNADERLQNSAEKAVEEIKKSR